MSLNNNTIDADLTGRIMSLEQRTKGMQGRISALEISLSGYGAKATIPEACACNDTEFVPAIISRPYVEADYHMTEAKISAKEESMNRQCSMNINRQKVTRAIDTTGIIAGAILIGIGLLLYSGNLDIIKNPLLAMGCGISMIAGVALRLVL